MEPVPLTEATISLRVDIEIQFDSFSGRTIDDITSSLQEEIEEFLFESSPRVTSALTSVISTEFI